MSRETIPDDMLEHAATHLVRLVNQDGTSGREAPVVDEMVRICEELQVPVSRMPVAPERDNLLIGSDNPRVVLCTHLDTVPPFIPASRDATHIYGRGSADARGVAVAMLHALTAFPSAPVACLFVVGEETDHVGATQVAQSDLRPEYIVLGEPCLLERIPAQKGLLKLRLVAEGRAAHSAYPEVGESAVHALLEAIARIRATALPADDALGETTVNVGLISGGLAANVIAPSAEATLLFRCATQVDAVRDAVTDRVGDVLRIEELSRTDPIHFFLESEVDASVGPAVPFNTDAKWLAPLGAKVMLLGPGDMRCAHAEGERLALEDLRAGIASYRALVTRLLATVSAG